MSKKPIWTLRLPGAYRRLEAWEQPRYGDYAQISDSYALILNTDLVDGKAVCWREVDGSEERISDADSGSSVAGS
jgi:hypothetical protein